MARPAESLLKLNWRWLFAAGCATQILLLANLSLGSIKAPSTIDWGDVAGESGAACLGFAWLLLILSSRPAGTVTNLLAAGLLTILISLCQDLIDEVIAVPNTVFWEGWIEAVTMPIGMVLVTVGLYLWRREQLVVIRQLRKRERLFRCYQSIDGLTQLPDVHYLKQQIALEHNRHQTEPFALLLLDLDNFKAINRVFGQQEGDRLLHALSELLILNVRDTDLVCRYAGDRYALLLPGLGQEQAQAFAQDIAVVVSAFVFYSQLGERIRVSASIGIACKRNKSQSDILQRATTALMRVKQSHEIPPVACA